MSLPRKRTTQLQGRKSRQRNLYHLRCRGFDCRCSENRTGSVGRRKFRWTFCCVVFLTRLKIMRQCFRACIYTLEAARNLGHWFRAFASQVQHQDGWWPQQREALAQHLKEELPCITAAGRRRGEWKEERQCQLSQSTDLVSIPGLPAVTIISLLLFYFVLN